MTLSLIQQRFSLESPVTIVDRPGVAVYRATRNGQTVAVKAFDSAKVFEQETDTLLHMHKRNVPVPPVLDMDTVEDKHVMVQEWWDGVPLLDVYYDLDRSHQAKLLREMGNLLARIHFALTLEELAEARFWHRFDFTDLSQFTWREYMQAQVQKILKRIKWRDEDQGLGLEEYCAFIEQQVNVMAEPARMTPIHNDYGLRNVLINRQHDALLGVIDFEHTIVGDPLSDLAKFSWNDIDITDTDMYEHFFTGWQETSGETVDRERLRLYQAYYAMGSIGWVDNQPVTRPDFEDFRAKAVQALRFLGKELVK